MNIAVLEGRITKDIELKQTPTGVSVTSFTIAVKRDYSTGAEAVSDFIDVVAWRNSAEFAARYFKKGDGISVVGKIQQRMYTDKDGNNRKAFEVVADKIEFPIGRAKEKPQESVSAITEGKLTAEAKTAETGGFELSENEEDLPF